MNDAQDYSFAELSSEGMWHCIQHEQVNADLFDRIKYLHHSSVDDEYFVVARAGDKIVGAAGLQRSPYRNEERILWLKFLSVDPEYKNQGIGRKLLAKVFEYTKQNDLVLQPSTFSDDGVKYLIPAFVDLMQQGAAEVSLVAEHVQGQVTAEMTKRRTSPRGQ